MIEIELFNINKQYGQNEAKVKALDEISLKIKKSESIAIIGPSGSGKSTLLNIIGMLDNPTSGEVIIGGTKISNLKENEIARLRNEKIGFIVQHFALISDYTVFENIELPLIYAKVPYIERKKKVFEMCKELGILEKIKYTPKELSGGQCQRVAIARALINNPEIILADEPTGALDSETGEEILNILNKLNKKGTTLVVVTHDINIANKFDKIIKVHDGKLM